MQSEAGAVGGKPPSRPAAMADATGESRGAAVWAWYGLGVLLMTTLFAFVVRQMLSLVAPALQTSLGFSDLQLGMLQGLGMAVFARVASRSEEHTSELPS